MWIRVTCLLAFHIPWDRSDSTFHYPIEALYKKPLGYIEGEELKSKKTIVHCCRSLLVLESASLYTLEQFVFFQSLPFLVSLLSRDGGLRWWRTQFLRFADVPTEVVTYVISDFIYRNIFFVQWCRFKWILNPWIHLIGYALLIIYSRVGLTLYYIPCFPYLLLLRVNC